MTYAIHYSSNTWSNNQQTQLTDETVKEQLEYISDKKNWRIVQLPNGFYQTEYQDFDEVWVDVTRRETIDGAEAAIDGSIEHYGKRLDFIKGPKVVKEFK